MVTANPSIRIELLQPNKTDALAYVDGGGPEPVKYAHVVIDHGASETPTYDDIRVGPLPIKNGTTKWEPLDYVLTRKTCGRVRNLDADSKLRRTFLASVAASVADITMDLWNASYTGAQNDTLTIWGTDPVYQDGDTIKRWDVFMNIPTSIFDVQSLLPMGLYYFSDVTGRDPSKWKVEGWYYNGVFYETTEEFRDAYWGNEVEKLGGNADGPWAQTDRQGDMLPQDDKVAPTAVAPAGGRFSVDLQEKYVEWMGWSFMIGFDFDTGMSLHDIRYKDQRILYELGLQEAMAHYAGSDPTQSHTAYLDTYYGFGPYAFGLLPGYDCPAYATMLNTSFYQTESTHTHVNSICLFEFEGDYPMVRHTAANYASATKNIYFVVRSVSTVGNYDYMFSYTFFLDGSLSVEVRASGYIQAAYYAKNEDYGFKITDTLSGSMHDHVLNFKADFDLFGVNNTVQVQEQVPETRSYPWSKGKVFNTMKLKRSFIENEDEGRFDWSPNSANQIFVVNKDVKNKYGEYRGYRVLPSNTAHLTMKESTVLKNAARWSEHDVAVTVCKDTEPRSSHHYNNQDTSYPPVNFIDFFDSENLDQKDLVLWLNLGMHHIPHTGDLPNTVFTTAHSGLLFMPTNYFDVGVNIQTTQMVKVEYGGGKISNVTTFKQQSETCPLNYKPVEFNLADYKGDVVVRKFPYSPNDPFYETLGVP